MLYGLWNDPRYVETAGLIIGALILLNILFFALKGRGANMASAWASSKSWLFVAPILFATFALPKPFPLIFLAWTGVLSAKSFFQMVGMYHRSWFVWVTYIAIFLLAYMIHDDQLALYNLTPMIFLFAIALVPLLRNSATHMIQYLALTLLAFIFWGWSYMHMGRLLGFPGGELMVLYLYLLTEVSENVTWACSKLFGKIRPFSRISTKVTLEGMLIAFVVTMAVAWGFRHLLPDRSEQFWIMAGMAAAIFGRMGDLIINVIRRDLGIKNTGIFIIGRDGIMTRVDKLIFVAPIFFYMYIYLQQTAIPQ
ncbi:MAG TPA: phosphatidate cytidylyltransferase [Bdellovibrionales bacterium]|nr:phosphatidate cytidylyltransferase [Bdellovibrionales bacterium]